MSNPLDLTNVKVSETFPRLIQIDHTDDSFYDGLGNPISFPIGGATGATGPIGPTGSNGLNGTSLSTLYSSNPGGSPSIIPGKLVLNTINDSVNSYEYFNSIDTGIYLQTVLPNITAGNSSYIGLFSFGGGLIYYGHLSYSSGPYIELYKQSSLIVSGNYTPGDLFSIYLDGINANYNIGSATYVTEQNINARFACTVSLGSFSGTPIELNQFLFYPTGRRGATGPNDLLGTVGKIPKFGTSTSLIESSISDDSGLVTIDSNTKINGSLNINTDSLDNLNSGDNIISTIDKTKYRSAFFDYYIDNGTSIRCGTVMSVWNSSGNTKYTDFSTGDLNGSTESLSFYTDVLNNDVRLVATITSGTWSIKTSVRTL
jgi:hypothetical protein